MNCTRFAILFLLLPAGFAGAQQRYFYHAFDYGHEANYNPLSLVINGGFDILQQSGHSRRIFRYNYAQNAANVFHSLGDPIEAIERYGWSNFLEGEIFPLRVKKAGANWWPNYQLHLIGGGHAYVSMTEWFEHHGYPSPALFAIGTMFCYHMMNEIVENKDLDAYTVDPVADIYLFDPAGILLFSFDNVKEFFSKTLNLADWSFQPMISPRDGLIRNVGQNFMMRWELPFAERWSIAYYFGMHGLGGLSYRYEDGSALTFCGGLRAKFIRRLVVHETIVAHEPDLEATFAAFYDVNNSLMASLMIRSHDEETVTLNVYPGIVRYKALSPGFWLQYDSDRTLHFGMNINWSLGIGLGHFIKF